MNLYMCVQVHVCAYGVYVCVQARGQPLVSSLDIGAWSSLITVDWLARKSQGASRLYFSGTWITSMPCYGHGRHFYLDVKN